MTNEARIVVCRCEEVTLEEIRQAIADGADSVRDVKLRTHAGMGVCQGMQCRRHVLRLLREAGCAPEAAAVSQRFPVRPATVETLLPYAEEENA